MTTPKLVTNPPQGSGLVGQLVDGHYDDLAVRGRPGELIPFVGLLQPVGTAQRRTKDGVHRTVTYEVVRLEPVRDPHEADNIAWEVTRAYERRTSGTRQDELPLVNSPAEQRTKLLEALDEWAGKQDDVDVDAKWVDYFGGPEHASSATAQAGSLVQLLEFTRYVGAVADEPAKSTDSAAPEDVDDTDPDAETAPGEGDSEPTGPAVPGPVFSDPKP